MLWEAELRKKPCRKQIHLPIQIFETEVSCSSSPVSAMHADWCAGGRVAPYTLSYECPYG